MVYDEKILPKYWNKDTQKVRKTYDGYQSTIIKAGDNSKKIDSHAVFNNRLENIKRDIKHAYQNWQNDNDGKIPSRETLRELLNYELKKVEKPDTKTFLDFFSSVIEQSRKGVRLHPKTGKPISPNTLKTYITTHKHLTEFQATYKKKIDFDGIDLDFYNDYTEYLMKAKRYVPKKKEYVPLNLSTNTVGKHIQIIKLIMNEATERGLNSNLSFKSKRFVTVREKSDSIYLTEGELKALADLELSENKRLERVRDLFLIGCYTGLRYSDYTALTPEHIKGEFIQITQIKTGDPVVVPVHDTVKTILGKYDGSLPEAISNQKTNDYLKDVGKKIPELKAVVSRTFTKGGLKITENYEKWQLLTTHTARRTFASNMYLMGIPALTIMQVTGHKTEKAFMRYIKLTQDQHAKLMQLHWNKAKLKAV